MAIDLSPTVKENLIRLLKSPDLKNHDLAFQMLDGITLKKEDYEWLWDYHQSIIINNTRRTTLQNFPNISDLSVLKGKLLAFLLSYNEWSSNKWHFFIKNKTLRMPYIPLQKIPSSLLSIAPEIREWVWQDGELLEIDSNIIQFQQLRRLDFRRQPIEIIHSNIADLPQLEEVYLISTSFLPDELSARQDVEIYTDAPY